MTWALGGSCSLPSWSLWRELRAEGRECGQDLLAKAQRRKAEERDVATDCQGR